MKKILCIAAILIASNTFAQKFKKLEVNVGASLFVPVTKDLAWENKAWGQRLQLVKPRNEKFAYVANLGIQQNRDNFLQIPALLGLRHHLYKNLYVTYGTGATFFKNEKARFSLTAGWGVQMKKLVIEQSVFRTSMTNQTLVHPHFNNAGLAVLYRL